MAKVKKTDDDFDIDSFSDKMIDQMNDMLGVKVVHNLGISEDPARIKKWYSTGCKSLDWIVGGSANSGFPGGRVSEVSGVESIGKSHVAYQVARCVQESNGITCYEDTELASSIENLQRLGINTAKRFQYSKPKSIEETFRVAEAFLKLVSPIPKDKKPKLCLVWDSVGGMGSEYEESLDFTDPLRPGANAKQIAFGLRKIRNALNDNDGLFLIINQVYDIINAGMYDKKTQTKGGRGLKYDCAVRVELSAHGSVYPDDMDRQEAIAKGLSPIGIKVKATTTKNKVAQPFRSVEFEIHFGVGIKEHNQMWDLLCKAGDVELENGMVFRVITNGAWKNFGVFQKDTDTEVMSTGNFRKKELEHKIMKEHAKLIEDAFNVVMSNKMRKDNMNESTIDPTILEAMEKRFEDEILDELG